MRGWWRDLKDLVLPAECGGCGTPRAVLCPECRAVLSGSTPRRVRPVPEPVGLPSVHAAAPYADAARAVLLAHKERGALALAGPLGRALAGSVRAGLRAAQTRGQGAWEGPGEGLAGRDGGRLAGGAACGLAGAGAGAGLLLVPVPSARAAVAARGHDPARRIALAAAAELRRGGVPARVLSVLRQRRGVADQAGLNSRERLDNLAGALSVVPGGGRLLLGGPVVLVDDVLTTGASLAEAARAVRAAMAEEDGDAVEGFGGRRAYGGEAVVRRRGVGGCGSGVTAVYGAVGREGRGGEDGSVRAKAGEQGGRAGMRGAGLAGGRGDVVCAAVVAASPDAFEINRN
ncbi:ComF family protein [Streptomyces aquilus]|uniref:ComF family protein n=1 Tax=Streptomyces aquilus TaxID=2548456 RepID=UPI001FCBD6BE|nr:ComF family protein [Streptomyces aquilus]